MKIAEPKGIELPPDGFGNITTGYQKPDRSGSGAEVKIEPDSDRLQYLTPFNEWDGKDLYRTSSSY